MTFNTVLQDLKQTQIVPTLDYPVEKGKNVIWCASFLCAWKTLQRDILGSPIDLQGEIKQSKLLNDNPDIRPTIPEECLFATSGWVLKGIVDEINKTLKERFPSKPPVTFPGIVQESFVTYAYLEASIRFALPYFQNREPLIFIDSAGKKSNINSFGIRPQDDYAYYKLRKQTAILYSKRNEQYEIEEFAMDLCRASRPSQIVIAKMAPLRTLSATIDFVEQQASLTKKHKGIGPNDVLLVPDIYFSLTHHFAELEGKVFNDEKLKGQRLDVAQQDILFRLDRSGAELKSESKMYCLPIPTYFVLDGPFLIYMKKRDVRMPYFAMWVDNTEFLQMWKTKMQDT